MKRKKMEKEVVHLPRSVDGNFRWQYKDFVACL